MMRFATRWFWLSLLTPALFFGSAEETAGGKAPSKKEIQLILGELSGITGLKASRGVESAIISREELKVYLADKIRDEVKPEQIHAEEVTLKKFGFVPQDFDLKSTTIELLTEQAAAFYDFQKKKLYLLSGANDLTQYPALVHEVAHALADQNFNLEKFINRASQDDGEMARMAVMEGQATWIMMESISKRMGFSLTNNPDSGEYYANRVAEMSAGQFPVFEKSPLYLRETLLFPYVAGMKFQNAAFHKMGQASFTAVFKHPPVSTQQILHPKTYFDQLEPAKVKAPEIADAAEYRKLAEGVVGELDYSILLRQYAGDDTASAIAPHWRGSQYRVYEAKKDKAAVLSCLVEWETPEIAAQFFEAYRKVLKGKWKRFEVTTETAGTLAGKGDDGYFRVAVDGARVEFQEGLKKPI